MLVRGTKAKAAKKAIKIIKAAGELAIKAILWIFKKCASAFITVKNKIVGFFNGSLFKKVLFFFNCLIKLKNAAMAVKRNVMNFINAVKKMNNLGGFIYVLVNAICNWKDFKTAVEFIVSAVKYSGARRFNFFGKAIGALVIAIGKSG